MPPEKLINYLLSESHPVGKSKARYFRMLGFDETKAILLADGLVKIAQVEEIHEIIETPYGTKYIVDGTLSTPSGP